MKLKLWNPDEKPQEPPPLPEPNLEKQTPPPLPTKNEHGELILPLDLAKELGILDKKEGGSTKAPAVIRINKEKEKPKESQNGPFKFDLPI